MTMRAILGTLLVPLLLLTGCGSDSGDTASPPASSSSPPPSASVPPFGDVDFDVVDIVSGSAARGPKVSGDPTVLDSEASVKTYAYRFQGGLGDEIVRAASKAAPAEGQTLVAAVVDVGCEPPTQLHVKMVNGELKVTATPVVSRRECFAPVTSVALVLVPTAAATAAATASAS